MRLVSIDPGSNKCGIAIFTDGYLSMSFTLSSNEKTPLSRRLDISERLRELIEGANEVVSEEPFLQGRNNNGMQRLLGTIELLSEGRAHFIHPMTIKKFCGSGSLDKLEVALAAGNLLRTELEQNILADAIAREAWDETDAVAIGLTHMRRAAE